MQGSTERVLAFGELNIDVVGREVTHGERRVHLTYQEFELLRTLVEHRGRALTREALIASLWTNRSLDTVRTVDIHVSRLRRKLGAPFGAMIETVRKVGYKCAARPAEAPAAAVQLGDRPAA
jgi:two-component system alkaline phosphatase synthesis response regulator PhoP